MKSFPSLDALGGAGLCFRQPETNWHCNTKIIGGRRPFLREILGQSDHHDHDHDHYHHDNIIQFVHFKQASSRSCNRCPRLRWVYCQTSVLRRMFVSCLERRTRTYFMLRNTLLLRPTSVHGCIRFISMANFWLFQDTSRFQTACFQVLDWIVLVSWMSNCK